MNILRFGFVGTGHMAARMMEAIKHMPEINVCNVYGKTTERVQQFAKLYGVPKWHCHLEEMLEDASVDAIYVANENELHTETCLAALRHGKAVLCEKPLATSLFDTHAVFDQASASKKLCMEAMWTHCLPSYRQLFEVHRSGALGLPVSLSADFGYPTSTEQNPRLFTELPGAGVLLDRGVYPVSLAVCMFGNVQRIHSELVHAPNGVDVHASLLLSHVNGCLSSLSASFSSMLQNSATVSYSGGSATLETPLLGSEVLALKYCQSSLTISDGKVKRWLKQNLRTSAFIRRLNARKNQSTRHFFSFGVDQYIPMLKHFCDSHRQGKIESCWIPKSLSIEVSRVIEAVKYTQRT